MVRTTTKTNTNITRRGRRRRRGNKKCSAAKIFLVFASIVFLIWISLLFLLHRYVSGDPPREDRIFYHIYDQTLRFHRARTNRINLLAEEKQQDARHHHHRRRRHPKVLGYYFGTAPTSTRTTTTTTAATDSIDTPGKYEFIGTHALYPYLSRPFTRNAVPVTSIEMKARLRLEHSRDYDEARRDVLEENDCVAMYEWQEATFPTCNMLHEVRLIDEAPPSPSLAMDGISRENLPTRLLSGGYWRDVWMVRDTLWQHQYAVKTLRYKHAVDDRNFDRHRRDAVAMERLTASNNILNIYGFCGNSGIFEFANGGNIEDMLWYSGTDNKKWTPVERLIVAYQVANALVDVHTYGNNNMAAIAHTDITTSQFLFLDGRYKLNDFNRCRFIPIHQETGESCGFYVDHNPGVFRSPEEYRYDPELTEKIDIFSMGNIFYSLLTELWPFEDQESVQAQEAVMRGERPMVPAQFHGSTEPATQALMAAMDMAWQQEPQERATAVNIVDYIGKCLHDIGVIEGLPQ